MLDKERLRNGQLICICICNMSFLGFIHSLVQQHNKILYTDKRINAYIEL